MAVMKDRTAKELLSRVEELIVASTARVEARFDALHEELTEFRSATESNYGGLSSRFDGLESRFGVVETRLTTFETKVDLRFDAVDARFDGLERRLTLVERRA
jgi:3-dehydroquinate dehydratase